MAANVKGEDTMAYETKVILTLLAQKIAQVQSAREAYSLIARAANVEGLKLPSYDELRKEMELEREIGANK